MKSAGWKVVDSGPDTRIAEFKMDNPHDTLLSYEEAKAAALQRLREHVAPYLARIEELEQDAFAEAGALPPLKAWRCHYGSKAVVTAKSKKRAMVLATETRYGFDSSWHECDGDWWYHLAHEEAVWIEEQDDRKQGTGVFYKPLPRNEAEQIIEQHILPYRTMGIEKLLDQMEQSSTVTGVSSQGTPYKVTIEVGGATLHSGQGWVYVRIEIDDCLGWRSHHSALVKRELPELAVAGPEEWAKEGF